MHNAANSRARAAKVGAHHMTARQESPDNSTDSESRRWDETIPRVQKKPAHYHNSHLGLNCQHVSFPVNIFIFFLNSLSHGVIHYFSEVGLSMMGWCQLMTHDKNSARCLKVEADSIVWSFSATKREMLFPFSERTIPPTWIKSHQRSESTSFGWCSWMDTSYPLLTFPRAAGLQFVVISCWFSDSSTFLNIPALFAWSGDQKL